MLATKIEGSVQRGIGLMQALPEQRISKSTSMQTGCKLAEGKHHFACTSWHTQAANKLGTHAGTTMHKLNHHLSLQTHAASQHDNVTSSMIGTETNSLD